MSLDSEETVYLRSLLSRFLLFLPLLSLYETQISLMEESSQDSVKHKMLALILIVSSTRTLASPTTSPVARCAVRNWPLGAARTPRLR